MAQSQNQHWGALRGAGKDSSYHSVETCHISAKGSTSEGALITCWLPKLSVTDPTEGVQRFLPSAQNLFIQSLFFTLACFQHLITNMLLRHHLNSCNWGSLLNFVLENVILKLGFKTGRKSIKNKAGKRLTKRQDKLLLKFYWSLCTLTTSNFQFLFFFFF